MWGIRVARVTAWTAFIFLLASVIIPAWISYDRNLRYLMLLLLLVLAIDTVALIVKLTVMYVTTTEIAVERELWRRLDKIFAFTPLKEMPWYDWIPAGILKSAIWVGKRSGFCQQSPQRLEPGGNDHETASVDNV